MRRWAVVPLIAAVAAVGAVAAFRPRAPVAKPPAAPPAVAVPWTPTFEGDFTERAAELVEVPGADPRLRLRAGTRGVAGGRVGLRSTEEFPLAGEARVEAELDWNGQVNASYLSAALILSPAETPGDDWVRVEYVGVPPRGNARLVVSARTAGEERLLQTEGWPDKNREGRPITRPHVELLVSDGVVRVLEDGRPVYEGRERLVRFAKARVTVQLTCGANYGPRELYFDHVRWVRR